MKAVALIIFVILASYNNSFSQKSRITVKDGEDIVKSIPDSIKFLYAQFVPGYVYFKDGRISKALLNYNLLVEEMQFIKDNDTLAIANEPALKLIIINKDSFYYDKSYLLVVKSTGTAKVAKKELLKLGDIQKIGAYNQPSSTSSTSNVSELYTKTQGSQKLDQRVNRVFIKQTTYYLSDRYNHFLPASKKNVLKIFDKKQNEIETFLNENKIRFDNEDDLKRLVDFL